MGSAVGSGRGESCAGLDRPNSGLVAIAGAGKSRGPAARGPDWLGTTLG